MFEVSIDGKKMKAEVSTLTAVLYESEFRKDLLTDFFGDILKTTEQVQVKEVDGEQVVVNVDFEKINWMAALRVLWAAVKTADESAPSFHEWSRKTKGLDLWGIRDELAGEVADCFFRAQAAEEEA
ncbi:MAG: hypothetical protein IJ092_06280 [Atopobiaceae bacterium]|nr:hypothetical protein [Atopobiaceae bacterium]